LIIYCLKRHYLTCW